MSLENALTFVQSIKGAPSSVLLALLMTRRSMTCQELQSWTGYGHDAITKSTRTLVELGCIRSAGPRKPWMLVQQPDGECYLTAIAGALNGECDFIGFISSSCSLKERNQVLLLEEEEQKEKESDLTALPVLSVRRPPERAALPLREQEPMHESCTATPPPLYFMNYCGFSVVPPARADFGKPVRRRILCLGRRKATRTR